VAQDAPLDPLKELHVRLQYPVGETVAGALRQPVLLHEAGDVGMVGLEVAFRKSLSGITETHGNGLKVRVDRIALLVHQTTVDRTSGASAQAHGAVVFECALQVGPEDASKVGRGGHGAHCAAIYSLDAWHLRQRF